MAFGRSGVPALVNVALFTNRRD